VFGASATVEIYDPAVLGPEGYASWHYLGRSFNDTAGGLCAFTAPVTDGGVLCDGGYFPTTWDAPHHDALAQSDAPYITDGGVVTAGEIWVGDYAAGSIARLAMNGTSLGSITGLSHPRGMVYDPPTHTVWVASQGGLTPNAVYAFHAESPFTQLTGSPFATGSTPLAPCRDGHGHIWIPAYSSNNVTVLSAEFGTPMLGSPFATGANPVGCASDGSNVWIANIGSTGVAGVTALSTTDGTPLAGSPFTTGSGPDYVIYAAGHVWVSNFTSKTATVLDLAGAPAAYSPVSLAAYGAADLHATGSSIWVAGATANVGVQVTESTGAVAGTAATGAGPYSIAFDGLYVWFTNTTAGTVTKINATTRAVIGTYAAGTAGNVYGIAYVPTAP
jgi:hypothetical protein